MRAKPVDSSRVILAPEFLYAGRRFLGMEEFLAIRCPCCGATDADTRHARLCHRSGAQVNQHQPLVHAFFRSLKRMAITTRWKAELRSTPTGIFEWTSSSRGEASTMLRHRSIETKRYFSTQRMPTRKRRATCVQAVLTGTGWLLPNLRRTSAPTTLNQDKCPSTSAAINSPPSRWKPLGASVRKVAT